MQSAIIVSIRLFASLFSSFFVCLTLAQAQFQDRLQLAKVYQQNVDIRQYWVSEKLDGVRGYWDGQQLLSRRGVVFAAPSWFVAGFPDQPVEGELWIDRGQFAKVSGIVRQKTPNNTQWLTVRFMIFDLPTAKGDFSATVANMQRLVAQVNSPYFQMIPQFRVPDTKSLDAQLKQMVDAGGEGLMLHRANASYQMGRTDAVLKVKQYEDAEAVVLQHLPGKGKFSGKMGALLVKNEQGVIFKIGSGFSLQQRNDPPPIGSVVSYKFYGKTVNNKPRFASFLRRRDQ